MNYPSPKLNPKCLCKDNPHKAFWCKTGHMLECHYPYTCQQAACSHLAKYDFNEADIRMAEAGATMAIRAGKMPPYEFDSAGNIIVKITPTEAMKATDPFTLVGVINQLLRAGVDRGSVVGKLTTNGTQCLLILALSPEAVEEVIPFVRDHAAKLKSDPSQRIQSERSTPLNLIFEAMQSAGMEWSWQLLQIGNKDGIAFFLVSNSIDEAFASGLTARGCVTNLK